MSSNSVAISARNLGKKYRIFHRATRPTTLRESIAHRLRHPFGNGHQEQESFWALRDVDLEIPRDEAVGIIGRNGAGKSTLLKLLSRITGPTTGTIDIYGRIASLLEVGTGFHPELTGRENIYLNGAIIGMTRREVARNFDEIVSFAEIERFLDTPVKRYSSGMYVRLAFAVAAHLDPEILVLDEVLAVGDLNFQKKCLGKMQQLADRGRTVIFVSHTMSSVAALCSKALLLTRGQVELYGPSEEVIRHYILGSGDRAVGSVSWPDPAQAPGDENLRLKSISIIGPDGSPTSQLSIRDEIEIQITYWNFQPNAAYLLNINLKDEGGGWVFTTLNTSSASDSEGPEAHAGQPVGLFRATCRIPGSYLNDHTYFVYLAIAPRGYFSGTPIVREEDIISFTIHDDGGDALEHSRAFLGSVRPRLNWDCEIVDDMDPAAVGLDGRIG